VRAGGLVFGACGGAGDGAARTRWGRAEGRCEVWALPAAASAPAQPPFWPRLPPATLRHPFPMARVRAASTPVPPSSTPPPRAGGSAVDFPPAASFSPTPDPSPSLLLPLPQTLGHRSLSLPQTLVGRGSVSLPQTLAHRPAGLSPHPSPWPCRAVAQTLPAAAGRLAPFASSVVFLVRRRRRRRRRRTRRRTRRTRHRGRERIRAWASSHGSRRRGSLLDGSAGRLARTIKHGGGGIGPPAGEQRARARHREREGPPPRGPRGADLACGAVAPSEPDRIAATRAR